MQIAAGMPVDIMPGPDDPANFNLPQQVFLYILHQFFWVYREWSFLCSIFSFSFSFFFFLLVSEVGLEWGSGELQFSLTPETCGSSFESTFGIWWYHMLHFSNTFRFYCIYILLGFCFQPLNRCLFPGSSTYNTFRSCTNPHSFELDGIR